MQPGQSVSGTRLAHDRDEYARPREEALEDLSVVGLEAGPPDCGSQPTPREALIVTLEHRQQRTCRRYVTDIAQHDGSGRLNQNVAEQQRDAGGWHRDRAQRPGREAIPDERFETAPRPFRVLEHGDDVEISRSRHR